MKQEEIFSAPYKNKKIVEVFEKFDEKDADRIRKCMSFAVFRFNPNTHKRKLVSTNFCHHRFCRECSLRISHIKYHNLIKILKVAKENYNQKFLHLTLSLKNCGMNELTKGLDNLQMGFKNLFSRRKYKRVINGYYRSLEITFNEEKKTFHPHLHIIIAVDPSYFNYGKDFLWQNEMIEEFKQSAKVDYLPTAHISSLYWLDENGEKVFEFEENEDEDLNLNFEKAIKEGAKYVTKIKDILELKDEDLKIEVMKNMNNSLYNRRLSSYGGILRKIFNDLKLEDEDNANLLHINDENDFEESNDDFYILFLRKPKEYIWEVKEVMKDYTPPWEYWRKLKEERFVGENRKTKEFIKEVKENIIAKKGA